MTYPSIFEVETLTNLSDRLDRLTPQSRPEWGKMNVGQMLAHNNVAFEMERGTIPTNHNFVSRFFVKLLAKSTVVGDKPYVKNGRTAPAFIISDERDFTAEKARLLQNLERMHHAGAAAYEGKVNDAFGKLSSQEWSTLYVKHLDHHLRQFGV